MKYKVGFEGNMKSIKSTSGKRFIVFDML